jgi:hypothetical protein
MTLKVVFRRAARAEFDAAVLRYDMQRPGLGAQFVSEVDRAVDLAATYNDLADTRITTRSTVTLCERRGAARARHRGR